MQNVGEPHHTINRPSGKGLQSDLSNGGAGRFQVGPIDGDGNPVLAEFGAKEPLKLPGTDINDEAVDGVLMTTRASVVPPENASSFPRKSSMGTSRNII